MFVGGCLGVSLKHNSIWIELGHPIKELKPQIVQMSVALPSLLCHERRAQPWADERSLGGIAWIHRRRKNQNMWFSSIPTDILSAISHRIHVCYIWDILRPSPGIHLAGGPHSEIYGVRSAIFTIFCKALAILVRRLWIRSYLLRNG